MWEKTEGQILSIIDIKQLKIGDSIGPLIRTISEDTVLKFNQIWEAGDSNQFIDSNVAKRQGLERPIVPGVLCLGLIEFLVTTHIRNIQILSLDVTFRRVIAHDSILQISGTITDITLESDCCIVELDIIVATDPAMQNVLAQVVAKVV